MITRMLKSLENELYFCDCCVLQQKASGGWKSGGWWPQSSRASAISGSPVSLQACGEKPCSLAWHYWERWDLMGGLQIIRALSNGRLWGPSLSFAPGCEVRSFTASLVPSMIGLASSNKAEIMDPILITFPSQANYLTSGSSEGSWLTRPVGDMMVRWFSRSRGWWVTSSWDSRLTSCVFSKNLLKSSCAFGCNTKKYCFLYFYLDF